ncbi:hypothetical protein YC2023_011557 [Brassica napus]
MAPSPMYTDTTCLGGRTQMINRNTIVQIHWREENGGGCFHQLHLNIEERNRSGGRRSLYRPNSQQLCHKQIDHLKGSWLLLALKQERNEKLNMVHSAILINQASKIARDITKHYYQLD